MEHGDEYALSDTVVWDNQRALLLIICSIADVSMGYTCGRVNLHSSVETITTSGIGDVLRTTAEVTTGSLQRMHCSLQVRFRSLVGDG